MKRKTAIELSNYLNTNYITPYTKACFALHEEYEAVIRVYVNDIDGSTMWISEWGTASHQSFRDMLYNMKCTPLNLGR